MFKPDSSLGRHSGEGRNPVIKTLREADKTMMEPHLRWNINQMDTGLRRYDGIFGLMDYLGLTH